MADMMTFPDTVEEFMEQYKIVDTDGIYMSKGAELVPIFRMRQWFEHLPSAQPEPFADADKLKRCRFEYINACKTVTYPTPDTSKGDIYDAYAVIKALHPIFDDEEF